MVGVIDYGMGNLFSVQHALLTAGAVVRICRNPGELDDAERIVLPGVGAFRDCIANLEGKGFAESLERAVFEKGKPLLGICLGMQVLARKSFEGGEYKGLGYFEAEVVRLAPGDPSLRVPQVGWNDLEYRSDSPLFNGVPSRADFYFVHSYYMKCAEQGDVDAVCDYGGPVTAAVRKNNVFATQFHPEKSQDYGLKILENFLKWNP
jgi:glutamine amidotransferase